MEELIRKSDAIKVTWQEPSYTDAINALTEARERINDIPAVEPWDLYDCDEWCKDCKEYDTEHHNCPRWNRVIRRTLEESQPKRGEWIFQECYDEFYGRAYECSICGVAVVGNHHNFCPNCGARMKGVDDETD